MHTSTWVLDCVYRYKLELGAIGIDHNYKVHFHQLTNIFSLKIFLTK